MKVKANELYEKGIISQNVLILNGKTYKIMGFDYETQEYELMEMTKVS